MFGSGLSFIPGLLNEFSTNYPWTYYFRTTIWSLFTLNGVLPAYFIMFLCVFYLKKYYEDGRLLHLIVFGILGFSAFGFKSSMGLHIMGAAVLTGTASEIFMKNNNKGRMVCTVSVLALFAMFLDVVFLRGGTGNTIISLDLFNHFQRSLKHLGYSDISRALYPAIFPCYLLAVFGIRVIGLYLLKDILKKDRFEPVVFFLIFFVISGFFLSEAIYLGTPFYIENDGVYFSVQALMAAWLLLAYFMLRVRYFSRKFFVYVCIAILLSVPSTAQFLSIRADSKYHYMNSDDMDVVHYLEQTPPESVILHPLNLNEPSLASNLAGRQSVISIFRSFVLSTIGEEEHISRSVYVDMFFNSANTQRRSFVLEKYKVDYVYAPLKYGASLDNELILERVLKNSRYVLYRVRI